MADEHKNFAYSTVATAPSPATSGTSLAVASGAGTLFPTPPFNVTIWPSSVQPLAANAEIARVTAKSTDTLTLTRAREGSSARAVSVGDQIAATITAQTLVDAEPAATMMSATGYRTFTRPPFTPLRTVVCNTWSDVNNALRYNLLAGDHVIVNPGVYAGTEIIVNLPLAAPGAVVDFLPGVVFFDSDVYIFYLSGCSNIQFYGGEMIHRTGSAFLTNNVTNITWWGFQIHDCAGGSFLCSADTVPGSSGMDFDGEVWNCGLDLVNFDPHAEKGTGLHGAYIGGSNVGLTAPGYQGKFSLYVHDQPTGAGVQVGGFAVNTEIWIKAERMTFASTSQIAGNAIQLFGSNNNITIHHVTAQDCQGLAVAAVDNMPTTTVEYAIADNCLLNPIQVENMTTPFETTAGITYQHTFVTPRRSRPSTRQQPGVVTANRGIVHATAAGALVTAALTPTFYPIEAPSDTFKLVDLAMNVATLAASSTVGIAIYRVQYNTTLAATRVAQLNAANSGAAAGVIKGLVTEGAAGAGAPIAGGAYLDFTANQYVVGVMASTATTLQLIGLNPPPSLGAFRWSTTARSSTTDWPTSFTSSSVSAISTSRVFWVGLYNADGLHWL